MPTRTTPPPVHLESATPQEVLAWALEAYWPAVIMTSSFGAESAALLHMATRIQPDLPVVFLDTGLLFPETLAYRDELAERLDLDLRVYRASPEETAEVRARLADPSNRAGACCDTLKAGLMRRALAETRCWIAGLRRDQASTRTGIRVLGRAEKDVVKVHPLAGWTGARVRAYMEEHDLPPHPLWLQGYTSIGCAPCTRRPLYASDPRSGRWPGLEKTECGLHAPAVEAGA